MLGKKYIFTIASLLIAIFALASKADYRQDSKTFKASGGEDHTLVLTTDKGTWACGPNGGYHDQVGPLPGRSRYRQRGSLP